MNGTALLKMEDLPISFNSQPDIQKLVEMLTYRRKEGSSSQRAFCKKYLNPVFGGPDKHGNYMLVVGPDNPRICFMAHHDTVHDLDGFQVVEVVDDVAKINSHGRSNCLGADCTTGVWLILHMITNDVPGRYVIHAGEEVGGIGANALLKDKPSWIEKTDAAISFDRKGFDSIITHQMGQRTCSDSFVKDLDRVLGGGWKADDTGTFTDSQVYSYDIPECTNLSVGYVNQHTRAEVQYLNHAADLAKRLVEADWSQLGAYRDPSVITYDRNWGVMDTYAGWSTDRRKGYVSRYLDEVSENDDMEHIILNYPERIADLFRQMGITREHLIDELGLHEVDW